MLSWLLHAQPCVKWSLYVNPLVSRRGPRVRFYFGPSTCAVDILRQDLGLLNCDRQLQSWSVFGLFFVGSKELPCLNFKGNMVLRARVTHEFCFMPWGGEGENWCKPGIRSRPTPVCTFPLAQSYYNCTSTGQCMERWLCKVAETPTPKNKHPNRKKYTQIISGLFLLTFPEQRF